MNENTSQFDGRPVVDSSSGSITYLDVKQALATQSRVIKALILREMLTLWRAQNRLSMGIVATRGHDGNVCGDIYIFS